MFQDRCGVVSANGSSPLENMRGLEHYLNDIMSPQTNSTDLKGKFSFFVFTLTLLKHAEVVKKLFTMKNCECQTCANVY